MVEPIRAPGIQDTVARYHFAPKTGTLGSQHSVTAATGPLPWGIGPTPNYFDLKKSGVATRMDRL